MFILLMCNILKVRYYYFHSNLHPHISDETTCLFSCSLFLYCDNITNVRWKICMRLAATGFRCRMWLCQHCEQRFKLKRKPIGHIWDTWLF